VADGVGELSLLSLGCGGARDLLNAAQSLKHARIYLNDIDPDALSLAESRLKPHAAAVELRHGNALRVLMRLARDHARFDAVVAGGLFDYFDDVVAAKLLGLISQVLKSKGRLFLTNISERNSWRAWMEKVLNWTLVHRSEWRLVELLPDELRDAAAVVHDETGLALVATCTRR
jgi:ubiquinone/menaquinone biosynthesis C-methylase UbiE